MKKLLVIGVLAFASTAQAGESTNPLGSYLGLQYGALELSGDRVDDDIDLDYGMIRLGVTVNESVALEGRAAASDDDDISGGIKFELESLYGIYGLYHFRMNPDASVYGIAGWSFGETKVSINTPGGRVSDQEDDHGFSYGIGAELYGVSIEAMRYLDVDDIIADVVAVGYTYHIK